MRLRAAKRDAACSALERSWRLSWYFTHYLPMVVLYGAACSSPGSGFLPLALLQCGSSVRIAPLHQAMEALWVLALNCDEIVISLAFL
jgi:hypothetical protein